MQPPKHQRGFTIIEVVITVAIVGILAAMSVPSYVGYIKRTRTDEAYLALASIRNAQNAYFVNEELGGGLSYAPDLVTLHWQMRGGQLGGKYYNYSTDERSARAVAAAGAVRAVACSTVKLIFAREAIGNTERILCLNN